MRFVEKNVSADIKSRDILICPRCSKEISLIDGEEFCDECAEEFVADECMEEIIWHPNRNY